MTSSKEGEYTAKEIEDRLKRTLAGAFSGRPTPLKSIPKKTGESRATGKKKPGAA